MKAISILQPWASAFFLPENPKRCENRDWRYPISYRGPILIHTGKGMSEIRDMQAHAEVFPTDPIIQMLRPLSPIGELPRGGILGRAELVDCLPLRDYTKIYCDDPWAFGDMCLRIENAVKFAKPIPYPGALGLFDIPDSILEGAS